ncbi:hypothetical protein [Plasticicumulans sp.]|uniref:hypothetical protein n=1 Tax=Plasticicumulans sp. TaxID=2307179 RepID=UPI00393A572D
MKFNPSIHHRRSIRLKGYDYFRAGAYFVTLCCECRTCLSGEVIDGGMHLNAAGEMIQAIWGEIPANYPDVGIAGFVVMPNHVHGIIVLAGASPP